MPLNGFSNMVLASAIDPRVGNLSGQVALLTGASAVVCDASFGPFGQAKIAIILLTVSVNSAISDTKR